MDYAYKYKKYKKKYLDLKKSDTLSGGDDKKKREIVDFYQVVYVDDKKLAEIMDRSSQDLQNIYKKIIEDILPKLRNLGWSADIVPLPLSKDNVYWDGIHHDYWYYHHDDWDWDYWLIYPHEYLNEKHGHEWFRKPVIYFVIYLDKEGKSLNMNRDINIYIDKNMDRDMKIKIIKIFEDSLPNNYEWTGKNYDIMKIYYVPRNIKKIDISKLKSEDIYPVLHITLDVKANLFETDVYKLDVIENILKCAKDFDNDLRYSKDHIFLILLTVDENKIYNVYKCILDAINDKNSQVLNYSANYYVNHDEYYELKKTKGRLKDKKASTYKDFIKKYEK